MTHTLLDLARQGDKAALAQMIEENAGLIWSIVRRYTCRGVETDDLYQLGCIGFIKAVTGFDDSFGTQFSTYAVPKIAGEIRRFLRDDGSIKISRRLKENSIKIKNACEELQKKLGREPVLSEISDFLDMPVEDIAQAQTACAMPQSMSELTSENGLTVEDMVSGTPFEENLVENLALRHELKKLPPFEKNIIALRYFRGLTQQKTAQILQVSQVQISRIERKVIARLRKIV